jgi:hypothetical protein
VVEVLVLLQEALVVLLLAVMEVKVQQPLLLLRQIQDLVVVEQ